MLFRSLYGNVVERVDRITGTDGLEYRLTTAMRSAVSQVDALSGTAEQVQLRVLASPQLAELQIQGFPEFETQMLAIHERVNADNYGRLDFSFGAPEGSAEIRRLSEELGIQPLQWQGPEGRQREGLLEIVLQLGEQVERIPVPLYRGLFGGYALAEPAELEDAVRQGLRSLVSANPRIAYSVSAGEKELADMQRGAGPFAQLAGESYELVQVDLEAEPIPADIDTLVLNGPTAAYSEAELYRIDQFVMRGGSLFVLLDRHRQILPTQQQMMAGMPPTWEFNEPGIAPLLEHWGLRLRDDVVLDEESFVARQQGGGRQQLFQAPVIAGAGLNRDNVITAGLEDIIVLNATELLPVARAEGDTSEDAGDDTAEDAGDHTGAAAPARPSYIPLLQTSARSWTVESPSEVGPWISGPPEAADTARRDVAVLLEGQFTSSFDGPVALGLPAINDQSTGGDPGGAPGGPEERPGTPGVPGVDAGMPGGPVQGSTARSNDATGTAGDSAGPDGPAEPQLAVERFRSASVEPGRVLVVSSSAMTTAQMLDPQNRSPNGTLLMNAIDYLNGAPGIAELRSKGLGVPRLDVASPASRAAARWANTILVPALVLVVGLAVWRARRARARRIRAIFTESPEDAS